MWRSVIFMLGLSLVSSTVVAQDNKVLRDSLALATEELAYHPDSIDLRLKKAAWNMELGQWAYAKEEYDYVLRRDPVNIAGLYYRAFVNEKLARHHFARLDYEHLLMLVPGNFEAQLGLALLNQKDKRYTEAYDQMNRLVALFPDSAIAYAARGGIEKERNMNELAEYDYSEAIKREPKNTDYLLNRAELRILLGRKKEAREDLDVVVSLGIPRASLQGLYKQVNQ